MTHVQALRTFIHGETRRRNSRFHVPEQTAIQLRRAGLVRILDGEGPSAEHPSIAGGEKSSASPAVPASPQTTAKPSKRGGRRKKDEE